MNNDKLEYLKSVGYIDSVKNVFGKSNMPEELVLIVADYLDSLNKLSDFFKIDINKILAFFATNFQSVEVLDFAINKTHVSGNTFYYAPKNDFKSNKKVVFRELTKELQNSCYFSKEDALQDSNSFAKDSTSSYITEIALEVSNNPSNALHLTSDSQVYNADVTDKPVNSSMLNLVALLSDIQISEVVRMSLSTDGMSTLKNHFNSYYGDNSFRNLEDQYKKLSINRDFQNVSSDKNLTSDELYDLSEVKYEGLSAEDMNIILHCETVMIQLYFNRNRDNQEYIAANNGNFEANIVHPKAKELYISEYSRTKQHVYVRERKKEDTVNESGFISLKYVLIAIVVIVFLVLIFI